MVEVVVDEKGGQHRDGEAEVVLLHHVSGPHVEQVHEAAQRDVKYAAGGSKADADGVHAPAAGGEAGDGGGADHAVRLAVAVAVAVEEDHHGQVLERVPGVQALERHVQMPKMRSEAPVNSNLASTNRLAASRP